MTLLPTGFMSYVQDDDANDGGRLNELRERLSGEVATQWGEPFPIFRDREDIAVGEPWKDRIEGALDSATFLIAVLTPRFFRSGVCRAELERFLKREQDLGRDDLILPIYYIDAPELSDPATRRKDPLAELIIQRQYWDWRPLRFESFNSRVVREMIARMASHIVAALRPPTVATAARPPVERPPDRKLPAVAEYFDATLESPHMRRLLEQAIVDADRARRG